MILRTQSTTTAHKALKKDEDSNELSQNHESDQEEVEEEEWQPKESAPQQMKKTEGMTTKPVAKNATKSREPKAKAVRKPAAKRAVAPKVGLQEAPTPAMKREEEEPAAGTLSSSGMESWWMVKEERLSFPVQSGQSSDAEGAGGSRPCFRQELLSVKNEDPGDDFTFEEPPPKKIKLSSAPQGKPVKRQTTGCSLSSNIHMNWDLIEVLSERMQLERWVCANLVQLFQEENTIPFIVRYRKEIINHMDADDVREVQLALEELCTVSKKCQSICQTLKKEGVLNAGLEEALKNCRTRDELEHVYAPYKKGSKLSKARRAKQLGLDPAAQALLQTPQTLSLHSWVKPHIQGVSTLEEVATGVEQILADMMAKDKETLAYVRSLCDRNTVTIHSSLSKTALKEKEKGKEMQQRPVEKPGKPKDIDKFHLYYDFTCDVRRIQHHQILAINRGENLKILTVKVNIPDWVKSEFCRWCVNVRWRPKAYAREDLMKILNSAVEDSYKRLIMPLLCRSYRSSLTAAAEKESVAMFVRNLRRRLLACPVRGRVIMGVDPGFKHGCKLAILSPTSQILHTDVVYLHCARGTREADKLRNLMMKYNCQTLVIGNGTACRETEAFFTDLIAKKFFHPLDVSYCITNEAGASIYSVSPEAAKEMPDLDPNLRSAVSIGRRVQDPLAELVKIDPKHIGIGTYQHDMSQASLKSALGGVVEECVSFVGVDVNMCSETLLRHVAGLNAGRARSIVEWREKSGPFINREQLKLVKGLGPKSFQQCAGFIRINPEHFQTLCSGALAKSQNAAVSEKPVPKKGKGKTSVLATPQLNALDQTCIHPESYSIAQRFLALIEGRMEEIGQQEMKERVEAALRRDSLEKLAKTLDTSLETLQLIVDGLTQPPSFDIRQNFEQADFKQGIVSMSDLQKGVVLTGRVENTTLFGAFVDIGVGCSGLIHKQYITPGKLPADLQRRSLALGPGERVEVRVLSVDMQRRRIGLDLIRVLR
ncbi:S1 RNA-binding domain-containing protein 1 isoform X2 [Scleropages formosus]|uniref:S1 RNA-binding domain-containing protein 1 isoform X2 n=1 Tax=Scleropages formosus TaxID=113540 RepID=UPI0010FA9F34|nr:S1 RNA-binding domain-containing protein 1 isoform X2 [Scleropages formosus]